MGVNSIHVILNPQAPRSEDEKIKTNSVRQYMYFLEDSNSYPSSASVELYVVKPTS